MVTMPLLTQQILLELSKIQTEDTVYNVPKNNNATLKMRVRALGVYTFAKKIPYIEMSLTRFFFRLTCRKEYRKEKKLPRIEKIII
ncbi:hypothetical protein Glove_415g13 [Diversispora epigaea]|uniref:Uncharacterized protein n=1 Tax=Diversispora epigaea TaxID=1348612 RepID=A0A397H224_9GLOM|nr:hypothetical protein Glove_415g13 [Diversispora epigaea]